MNGAFTALYWWSPEFRVARRNEFGEKLLQQPGARLVRRVGHPRPKQISGNAYLQTGIERMYAVDLNSKLTRTEIKEGATLLLKGDWFLSHDTAREIDLLLCETWDDAQLAMRTFDGVLSPFCQQVSAAVQ
jgi:hypothetical protein